MHLPKNGHCCMPVKYLHMPALELVPASPAPACCVFGMVWGEKTAARTFLVASAGISMDTNAVALAL